MDEQESLRVRQERHKGRLWSAVSIVLFVCAWLSYKFMPSDSPRTLAVLFAFLLAGIGASAAAYIFNQDTTADELGEQLGLKRKGLFLTHGSGSAKLAGLAGDLPVELDVIKDYSRNSSNFGADLAFTVRNPYGLKLVIFAEGLLNHPLGFFPPEIKERPDWMARHKLKLMAEPAQALQAVIGQLEVFSRFTSAHWHFIRLKGGSLTISVRQRTRPYSVDELRGFLNEGAKAARLFN